MTSSSVFAIVINSLYRIIGKYTWISRYAMLDTKRNICAQYFQLIDKLIYIDFSDTRNIER